MSVKSKVGMKRSDVKTQQDKAREYAISQGWIPKDKTNATKHAASRTKVSKSEPDLSKKRGHKVEPSKSGNFLTFCQC